MATVRRLLQSKGTDVWSISPDDTILSALNLMADKNVGALVVCEGSHLIGIFSERDYARKVARDRKTGLDLPVSEFMTSPVFYVNPDQTIEECMALMTEHHFRHLPVIDHDKLTGLISIGDVVKEVISDHEFTIQHLENYITGKK